MRSSFAAVLAMAVATAAKTVTFDWNVTWVKANPDGLQEREIVGINNQWPLPLVEVNKGDRIIANVYNGLGNMPTSVHWHGLFQNGSNAMDGPSMINQCPLAPGASMTYNFTIDQTGTYWYHCHTDYCYPDGYRQALIVHDDEAYFAKEYEKEYLFTMSDWYHKLVTFDLSKVFMNKFNPTGAEPVPDAFLQNDGQNNTFAVEPGKKYLFRVVSIATFIAQYFYIEGHNFTIVEIDGVYTEPYEASLIYVAVGQRYTIMVETKNTTDVNYKIVTVADADLMDTIPPELQLNNTNWLVYNKSAPLEPAVMTVDTCDDLYPMDDMDLVPYDHIEAFQNPTKVLNLTVYMVNLMTGANYATFDYVAYTAPKVPSLYTALNAGEYAANETVYGEFSHPYVLKKNEVVEVIINNADSGTHPFHLHGHNFQITNRRPRFGEDFYSYLNANEIIGFNPENDTTVPKYPARRDVAVLPAQGYMVLRFVADNPGVWIFHCHIDWHLASGLAFIFVEAPDELAATQTIPDDHLAACEAASVPTVGNAAGNTKNYMKLDGQPKAPKRIPQGWTGKGEVAMAFSVLSAVLGIAAITVYGLADLKHREVPNEVSSVPNPDTASDETPPGKTG